LEPSDSEKRAYFFILKTQPRDPERLSVVLRRRGRGNIAKKAKTGGPTGPTPADPPAIYMNRFLLCHEFKQGERRAAYVCAATLDLRASNVRPLLPSA
jgi:hypothetical protein